MGEEPRRPDPDALLAAAAREGRGRLKVFLGAAPGVGKTFEMLGEARQRAAGGADIVVGLVETHGRADTAAQLGTLEVLPRVARPYRGQVIEEFDLDAALARRPAILLLDELAHTNAPGSRHNKRWQDVEELRAAGIEVWTTMNVQHLRSLSDKVARITGVRVAETVPDLVLAEADAVELVDIPSAELLQRLRDGKVYRPDQAARALKGFFREGNLAALREMALRRTAERVDADVTGYMRSNAISGPWPSGERVLALIGSDEAAEGVLWQARRLADALRAPLVALHVERPGAPASDDPAAALRLAASMEAEVETVVAGDLPRAVLEHARAHNATQIVMGRGRPSRLRRMLGRTLAAALLRGAGDFTLHVLPAAVARGEAARAGAARPGRRRALPHWLDWVAVPAVVGLATAISFTLDSLVPEGGLGMVYLAAVVALATWIGPMQALLGAVLSFSAWNFLFLSPRYSLTISSAQDVMGVVVFAAVALLLLGTTGNLGRSVTAARGRLFALRRLVDSARKLAGAGSGGDLLLVLAQEAERVAGCPVCVLMPLDGEPVPRAAVPIDAEPDADSMAAARWVLGGARRAGAGTDTLPGVAWQFRPIRTIRGHVGLLGIRLASLGENAALEGERDRLLDAILDQAAVAIERSQLMEEQARHAARAETETLRNALLASLGHDLRTPLTGIRGALETLRTAGPALSPETREDLLQAAEEETVRLNRYLSNILDIVRLEEQQVRPRREAVEVAEALEATADRAARGSGRPVRVTATALLPPVQLDPVLLDQVLMNLLDNALKFSAPHGTVTAAARREGANLTITVEDNGPGIPPEQLSQVFDPFFRVRRGDKAPAGSGLGLAICRGLTEAMGGRITAESPLRDGRGTRLVLRFPL
ncbi:ATP-binding protein [Roseomonas elaeocarpi]|uniref:histidine kinase n=1 Tax=Roseomonas elaeocarpi TaxID=907779 RepID=A0ABV6JX29_9PROT